MSMWSIVLCENNNNNNNLNVYAYSGNGGGVHAYSEYKSIMAMRMTPSAKNSRKPIPMRVYVNKSSFMEGLRARPITIAAKS